MIKIRIIILFIIIYVFFIGFIIKVNLIQFKLLDMFRFFLIF